MWTILVYDVVIEQLYSLACECVCVCMCVGFHAFMINGSQTWG